MPIKCYFKQQRSEPRFFTEKKVIELGCLVAAQGRGTIAAMQAGLSRCADPGAKRSSEALEALQAAQVALEQNNILIDADASSLNDFLALPVFGSIVLRIISRIPVAGPVLLLGLPALREVATARIKAIIVQKAANDAALQIVRRAAANEARFIRTGTGG